MAEDKRTTLTIRLTDAEKSEADACASYLGLPLSTFFRFAAKSVFNEHRAKMIEAGLWAETTSEISEGVRDE